MLSNFFFFSRPAISIYTWVSQLMDFHGQTKDLSTL